MNKLLLTASFVLLTFGLSSGLHAQGNAQSGKPKSATCASCHGPEGNSMIPNFPKLAQQHESYLIKQLNAFKNGSRKNPMMSGIAKSLSDQDIADLSAYYAEQKISENKEPQLQINDDDDEITTDTPVKTKTLPELMTQGADLYRNGDLEREVSACIACHGPSGDGNQPAAFPLLKSQHADYLIKTLTDYKTGSRTNNPENIMQMIAKKMTDEEIKAVAYRISMMK